MSKDSLASARSGRRQVKSVANALRLLIELAADAEDRADVGVTELARRLGLGASTVHVLLSTLVDFGFVDARPGGRYRLGLRAFEVGVSVREYVRLCEPLGPSLEQLAVRSEEAASLAVRRGLDALIVARCESSHVLRAEIRVGTPMPLHASASGKCLLAGMPDEQVALLYANGGLGHGGTPHAVKTIEQLTAQLRKVRADGHAINRDEFMDEITAIAAPVRDRSGAVAAAVSLAGPTSRFDAGKWLPAVLSTAAAMTSIVGRSEGLG
jgi:IclR family acetate operon transcriptional repressor